MSRLIRLLLLSFFIILFSVGVSQIIFAISSGNLGSGGGSTNNYYNVTNITGGNITGNITANYIPQTTNGSHITNSLIQKTTLGYSLNTSLSHGGLAIQGNFSVIPDQYPSGATGTLPGSLTSVWILGARGGNTTDTNQAFASGLGGWVTISSGHGGQSPASTNNNFGHQAGRLTLVGGDGGSPSTSVPFAIGGTGGQVIVRSGAGGSPSAGTTRSGGQGGVFSLSTGAGGAGTNGTQAAARAGGKGGDFNFNLGAGGSSTLGIAGTGGVFSVNAGQGGDTTDGTAGNSGEIFFQGARGGRASNAGYSANGTSVYFRAGGASVGKLANGTPGNVYITGNVGFVTNNSNKTGHVFLQADNINGLPQANGGGFVAIRQLSTPRFVLEVNGNASFNNMTYVQDALGLFVGTSSTTVQNITMTGNDFYVADDAEIADLLVVGNNIGIKTYTPTYNLEVNGTTRSNDYYSGDGTQGFTGTCTIAAITSITVKDGLITGCS